MRKAGPDNRIWNQAYNETVIREDAQPGWVFTALVLVRVS
jgi:hypothetical protein